MRESSDESLEPTDPTTRGHAGCDNTRSGATNAEAAGQSHSDYEYYQELRSSRNARELPSLAKFAERR